MIDQLPAMLVPLATLVCCLMIGLGFLYRPSRASAIWSGAFVAAMVASYVSAARAVAGSGDAAWLDAATAGLLVLALGLVWVGLRAHRGRRRVMIVPTFTTAAGLAILLLLATGTDVAGTEAEGPLRALTAGLVGLAAAGIAVELALVRATQRTVRIPLLVGAGLTLVYAATWIGAGAPWDGSGRLSSSLPTVAEFIPTLAVILLVTALTTVLLIARAEVAPTAEQAAGGFRAVARDRLARAERLDDSWWSLLDVRLDDPVALREASSTLAYTRVLDRFADDVAAVFPAEADIDRVEPTRFLVLLPRQEPSVRPLLRTLLDRLSTVSAAQPLDVRLSASVGWASAAEVGYDLDDLIVAASAAADAAQLSGGDGWERAASAAGPADATALAP